MIIRKIQLKDAKEISRIYNYYIKNTIITFEENEIDYLEIENRIKNITSKYPWYVYEDNNGNILGYAYASKWKARYSYRFTAETTIYLDSSNTGKGIGLKLYTELLDSLKFLNIHAVMAIISIPNEKSQNIHEKLGFKKAAHFKEVGYKFGKWIDIGYWEMLLD
ncbi:MAG: N-acetyltransferase family protein [Clostridiales bacterium]